MISQVETMPPGRRQEPATGAPGCDSLNAILLLYHHPISQNAPTILEHVHEFKRHSKFKICQVNTEFGFPPQLRDQRFRTVMLHYSLFGSKEYALPDGFHQYLAECETSHKVAFFQDEYNCCTQRFQFINRYKIDTIYTLVEPRYFDEVYLKYTNTRRLVYNLPSYVSNDLPFLARKYSKPDADRRIDVGYRGRVSWAFMGKGAAEKREIAEQFSKRARELGLKLDIEVAENKRIYGNRWYQFLGDSKAALGVEAGVSIFDLEDKARLACDRYLAKHPFATFEELSRKVLSPWENNIPYRTIGPRHFEAAALRTCQILYEGEYSGVLRPMVHYIPLKKDFSNFERVIGMFRDANLRRELTENAYRDLIASGKYTYRQCVEDFDRELEASRISHEILPAEAQRIEDLEKTMRRRAIVQGAKIVVRAVPRQARGAARRSFRLGRQGLRVGWRMVRWTRRVAMTPFYLAGLVLGSIFGALERGFQRGRL